MEKHSDVLIIGGGVIGLACAYYLAKAGQKVRLLEQDQIGAGASYGNCGLIFSSHLIPLCAPGAIRHEIQRWLQGCSPLYIEPAPDMNRFRWLLNFARKCNHTHLNHAIKAREQILTHSRTLYAKLFQEEQIECDWEERGVLMIFKTRSAMQKYGKNNALLKPFGQHAVSVSADELYRLEPALRRGLYGAWYHKTDGHLRPDKLLLAWKRVLTAQGIIVEENSRLKYLITADRQIRGARTAGGNYTAGAYVLATGAWTPQLTRQLNLDLPVQPGKGYSLTMPRPETCPQMPCYFYERSVVATPWKSGFRLGGTMEFSGLNSNIVARRIQNLISAAAEYLKAPLGNPVMEEWVGMRPMVYDDLPIIDRAPNHPNLVVATGHGMSGISMATSTGKLVAEMVSGHKPHIDPTAFGIRRFKG
ncbi:MAG: FAD-dependent oxidoreductase [Deltaproteobacteria bacterium]|jgi:D-amino-acid dehydrogenase|nr:FAD-dependent oxidoreductase [Deltaproteobacteria bacterium]